MAIAIDLGNYDKRATEAVRTFWAANLAASELKPSKAAAGQGEQAGTSDGESMAGFEDLVTEVVFANGLTEASVHVERRGCIVPGHFWPTAHWDMLVINSGQLVAAIEFQSHVGPASGRVLRSITEETIENAKDLWAAYRTGAFGGHAPHPFVGWLMLLEDGEESRSPVIDAEPHFSVLPEFEGTSYAQRCGILCRKLVRERLYTAACLLVSPRAAPESGKYSEVSDTSSLRRFVMQLAARIAVEAARSQSRA